MTLRRAPLEYNRTWQMRLWLFGVFFFPVSYTHLTLPTILLV